MNTTAKLEATIAEIIDWLDFTGARNGLTKSVIELRDAKVKELKEQNSKPTRLVHEYKLNSTSSKLSNKFTVQFNALYSGSDLLLAKTHLDELNASVYGVTVPDETFQEPMSRRSGVALPFIQVQSDGLLELKFKDDGANKVQQALDFIKHPYISRLSALVMKIDDLDRITEAHLFGAVKLISMTHSALNRDIDGAPVLKVLSVHPNYTLRATFDVSDHLNNEAAINALIGKL